MKGYRIPAFQDGDFNGWQQKYECVAKVKKWSPEEKALHLPLHLEGEAFALYSSLSEKRRESFDDVCVELKRVFGQKRTQILIEFENLKMDMSKSARTYLVELQKLCKECYPNFNERERDQLVHDRLLKGMPQQYLNHIICNPSLNDSEAIAEVLDKIISANSTNSCQVAAHEKSTNDIKALQEEIRRLQLTVEKMNQPGNYQGSERPSRSLRNTDDGDRRDVQCYRCQRFGHTARFCTSRMGNFNGASSRGNGRL